MEMLLEVGYCQGVENYSRALSGRKPGGKAGRPASPVPELVACAYCGVHLPKNEALAGRDAHGVASGRYFCGEDHLKLGSD